MLSPAPLTADLAAAFGSLFHNQEFWAAFTAWVLAQLMKVPVEYLETRKFNWALLFSPGGMPSSHSALVTALMVSVGLNGGWDSPLFALTFVLWMVVTYDAAGVRQQAGFHAQRINMLIDELIQGHPISERRLREVIGHTPRQVVGGIVLGALIAVLLWWRLP